jgi:hypothetical protein
MRHQHSGFWRNSRRFTSLVLGVLFLVTALPVSAQYKPRDRKPASENSRAGGSRMTFDGMWKKELIRHSYSITDGNYWCPICGMVILNIYTFR